jgi:hypothetical protein
MLSGSVAMSLYVEPRFTRDYEFIVHLKHDDVVNLMSYFKEGYYWDEDAVKDAVNNKGMFNIIDFKSNYKADFVILKDSKYRQTEFERRRKIDFLEMKIDIVSPEDLLLSKLIWIQDLQSGVQMEDIKALHKMEELDRDYIHYWIKELNLNTFDLLKNE